VLARKPALFAALAALVIAGTIGSVYASYYRPQHALEEKLPDEVVIDSQKDLKEVDAFLDAYSDSGMLIKVDRSGRLAVDYRAEDADTGKHPRLRVFSDAQPRPLEMFVDCFNGTNSTLYYENVLQYIESKACLRY
jgi:hypothetical protein